MFTETRMQVWIHAFSATNWNFKLFSHYTTVIQKGQAVLPLHHYITSLAGDDSGSKFQVFHWPFSVHVWVMATSASQPYICSCLCTCNKVIMESVLSLWSHTCRLFVIWNLVRILLWIYANVDSFQFSKRVWWVTFVIYRTIEQSLGLSTHSHSKGYQQPYM